MGQPRCRTSTRTYADHKKKRHQREDLPPGCGNQDRRHGSWLKRAKNCPVQLLDIPMEPLSFGGIDDTVCFVLTSPNHSLGG